VTDVLLVVSQRCVIKFIYWRLATLDVITSM